MLACPWMKQPTSLFNILMVKSAKKNSAQYQIEETEIGDFTLEIDAAPIQELASKNEANKGSDKIDKKIQYQLNQLFQDIGTGFVPNEIVCPPVKVSDIPKLESFCNALRDKGAKGSKDNMSYAFGLHINPEAISFDADYILRHIQSFLLLSAWLKKNHKVDMSRRITSFIDPFPKEYYSLVLDKEYAPDLDQLIIDYHKYNPSRNRALDMLPLFSYLNEDLVNRLYPSDERISARPTFHYRLPNCEIGNPRWGLDTEWSRWLYVEKLAGDKDALDRLIGLWRDYQLQFVSMESGWIKTVDQFMDDHYG